MQTIGLIITVASITLITEKLIKKIKLKNPVKQWIRKEVIEYLEELKK